MDNGTIRPTKDRYNLVNIETGKIEEENLLPLEASDRRNILWARGIKTKQVVRITRDESDFPLISH